MAVFLPTGPHLYCNFHSRTLNQPYATFVSGNERRAPRGKPADLPSHTNSTCASVSLPSRLPPAHSEHGEDGCSRREIQGHCSLYTYSLQGPNTWPRKFLFFLIIAFKILKLIHIHDRNIGKCKKKKKKIKYIYIMIMRELLLVLCNTSF